MAVRGEFDSIGDIVQKRLLQARWIAEQAMRQWLQFAEQRQIGRFSALTHHGQYIFENGLQVDRFFFEDKFPGLDF